MMIDVDGLSRRLGVLLTQYLCIATLLYKYDVLKHSNAYAQEFNKVKGADNSHYYAHSLHVQYYVNHVRRINVQHKDTKSSNHSETISYNIYSTLLYTTKYLPTNYISNL